MDEFQIGDRTFRVNGLMEPRRAFHVARRLMPLSGAMKDLLPIAMQLRGEGDLTGESVGAAMALLEPITQYLAEMPEADANYVIDACLDVILFKVGEDRGWVKVATEGHFMFNWITMPMMIRMVVEVVRTNLIAFFPGLASALSAA